MKVPGHDHDVAAPERLAELERENAELRARLVAAPVERRRRRRVALLMAACGTAAAMSGVFAASPMLIVFGLGWLIGGGAISSLEPREPGAAQAPDDEP